MRMTIVWTLIGTVLPGAGLIKAKKRLLGGAILAFFTLLAATTLAVGFGNQGALMDFVTNPTVLNSLSVALLAVAVLWVVVICATHLSLRPEGCGKGKRAVGALAVTLLALAVTAPSAAVANITYSTGDAIDDIFNKENQGVTVPSLAPVDPWADKPRLNVLLLGSDSSPELYGRSEKGNNIRTDTVIVASIDTKTGDTTLISLPRQTAHMPFPKDSPLHKKFPDGFYDGSSGTNAEFFLNAMWRNLPNMVDDDILGNAKTLSQDALKLSVGTATGLDIDYFVLLNLDGFVDFIKAIGGITVNVNYPVPIGGQKGPGYDIKPVDYIQPGPDQHLNGKRALWFARGRYGLDDYSRIERQRCVINAVVQQTTPATVLASYQSIAAAAGKSIRTDIPANALPALLDLAGRVQGTKMRSLYFVNGKNGFKSADPDFKLMRSQVQKALADTAAANAPEPTASAAADPTASADPTAGATTAADPTATAANPEPAATGSAESAGTAEASASPSPTKTAKPKSDDLDDACAYNPGKYKAK
jgi:LCP family protein required for cell wall assembly